MFNKIIKAVFIFPIRVYQWTLSPLLGANKCRYQPTCSHYMIAAVHEWGVLRGGWIGLRRILRCHPWGGHGFDPIPKKKKD